MIINPIDNQPLGKEFFLLGAFVFLEYFTLKQFQVTNRFIWLQMIFLAIAIILFAPPGLDMSFIYFQF